MTLIFMDGFDDRGNITNGYLETPDNYDGWGIMDYMGDGKDDGIYGGVRDEVRYGTGFAWCCEADEDYENFSVDGRVVVSGTYFFLGFSTFGSGSAWMIRFKSATGGNVEISASGNGQFYVTRYISGTTREFSAYSVPNLQKNYRPEYVRIYVGINIGAGSDFVQVWHNGQQIIDATGLTLGGNGACALIEFPVYTSNMDDTFIYASSSTITTHGEPRIFAMKPNGAGSNSDFTPNVGTNYEAVDEWLQDGDTTENESDGTSGHRDDFEIENLSGLTGTGSSVKGLLVRVMAQATASEQIYLYVDVGGTKYYSPAKSPPNGYYYYVEHIWELNPSTSSPWTVTEIDSVKIGYEVV